MYLSYDPNLYFYSVQLLNYWCACNAVRIGWKYIIDIRGLSNYISISKSVIAKCCFSYLLYLFKLSIVNILNILNFFTLPNAILHFFYKIILNAVFEHICIFKAWFIFFRGMSVESAPSSYLFAIALVLTIILTELKFTALQEYTRFIGSS